MWPVPPDVKGMNRITSTDRAVTTPLVRRLNGRTVLAFLRASGTVTASEMMAGTGLSRPTVHSVCEELIAAGWVVEVAGRRSPEAGRTGRLNRCYEFNARAGYVLAIDLGASSVRLRVSDLRGRPIAERVDTVGFGEVPGHQRIRQTRRTIRHLLARSGIAATSVLAATVGVASPVDSDGRPFHAEYYLSGLGDQDLRRLIGRDYSWPVFVENDADLAVLGERWRGVGAGTDSIIVLLAGERLGAGLFLDGRLIRGHRGAAGELQFLALVDRVGNTDGIAHLARRWGADAVRERSGPTGPTGLYALSGGRPEKVDAETVFTAARGGDPSALDIVERISERIARVIAVLSTLLNPEKVVLAGGFAPSTDLLLPSLTARVAAHTPYRPAIVASTLGDHAVILGATRHALDHVEAQLPWPTSAGPTGGPVTATARPTA